jgi:uncharacterized protein
MNVMVSTHEAGLLENDWTGHRLQISDGVRLGVAIPDPRCVMAPLAQDELPKDTEVLRTLARQNRLVEPTRRAPAVARWAAAAPAASAWLPRPRPAAGVSAATAPTDGAAAA